MLLMMLIKNENQGDDDDDTDGGSGHHSVDDDTVLSVMALDTVHLLTSHSLNKMVLRLLLVTENFYC